MREYEVMTIHRPDLAEDEVEARITELETHLSGQGATVEYNAAAHADAQKQVTQFLAAHLTP